MQDLLTALVSSFRVCLVLLIRLNSALGFFGVRSLKSVVSRNSSGLGVFIVSV